MENNLNMLDAVNKSYLARDWSKLRRSLDQVEVNQLDNDSLFLYIHLREEIGEYQSVLNGLEILLSREGLTEHNREQLLLRKARYSFWLENYKSAEQILLYLPESPQREAYIALLHYLRWDLRKALHHLRRVRERGLSLTHEAVILSDLIESRVEAIAAKTSRIERYLMDKDPKNSIFVSRKPIALKPVFPETNQPERVLQLMLAALNNEAHRNYIKAEQLYRSVIDTSSLFWWSAYRWARCCFAIGYYDFADSILDDWSLRYQRCPTYYEFLSVYFYTRKRYTDALQYAQEGLKFASYSPMLNFMASKAALRLKRFSQARRYIQTAAQSSINYGWSGYFFEVILSGAVFLCMLTGYFRDAIRYYTVLKNYLNNR